MVVTRAHSCDIACLRSILQKPAAYVGMMGSRKRAALVHTQLAELGLPQERIDALHAPIGLSIGAKTAQEIALSILAEIVSVKNSRQQTEGFSPVLLAALEQQTAPAVLATIVGRHGSTPRRKAPRCWSCPMALPWAVWAAASWSTAPSSWRGNCWSQGLPRAGWPPLPQRGLAMPLLLQPAAAPWKSFCSVWNRRNEP